MPFGIDDAVIAGSGIISSLLGGLLGGRAANEQAAASYQGATAANQQLWNQQQLNRSDLAPYVNAGQGAVTTLANLLGVGARPGTAQAGGGQPGALPKDIQDKQNRLNFLQSWLDGKRPIGADGKS